MNKTNFSIAITYFDIDDLLSILLISIMFILIFKNLPFCFSFIIICIKYDPIWPNQRVIGYPVPKNQKIKFVNGSKNLLNRNYCFMLLPEKGLCPFQNISSLALELIENNTIFLSLLRIVQFVEFFFRFSQ